MSASWKQIDDNTARMPSYEDPLSCLDDAKELFDDGEAETATAFACSWTAEEEGYFGHDWGTKSLRFDMAARTKAALIEEIAAEIVRQDEDTNFNYRRAFGPIREIELVGQAEWDPSALDGTMAFRSCTARRADEARQAAEIAAKREDEETRKRRAAFEALKAEFEPAPIVPDDLTPAEKAAQSAMLASFDRPNDIVMYDDLVVRGREMGIGDPWSLISDLESRGVLKDRGVWNGGGYRHGENVVSLGAAALAKP